VRSAIGAAINSHGIIRPLLRSIKAAKSSVKICDSPREPAAPLSGQLNLVAIRRILRMQTRLSARFAVISPAGGEMSGLIAHFLFGANLGCATDGFPRATH
jgi:hypothetical protein